MNNEQFAAALAKDIADALHDTFVERSLIAPDEFVFEQAFTSGGRAFVIRVSSTVAEQPRHFCIIHGAAFGMGTPTPLPTETPVLEEVASSCAPSARGQTGCHV